MIFLTMEKKSFGHPWMPCLSDMEPLVSLSLHVASWTEPASTGLARDGLPSQRSTCSSWVSPVPLRHCPLAVHLQPTCSGRVSPHCIEASLSGVGCVWLHSGGHSEMSILLSSVTEVRATCVEHKGVLVVIPVQALQMWLSYCARKDSGPRIS